jgi:hypothetical protein
MPLVRGIEMSSSAAQQEAAEIVLRVAMNRRAFVSLTREAEVVFKAL